MVFIHGQTVENMKEIIKMIKSMVTEHIFGLMVRLTKVCGIMVSSMVKQSLQIQKVEVNTVFGKMGNE